MATKRLFLYWKLLCFTGSFAVTITILLYVSRTSQQFEHLQQNFGSYNSSGPNVTFRKKMLKKSEWLFMRETLRKKTLSLKPLDIGNISIWDLNSLNDHFENVPQLCKDESPYLLILVTSAPSNFNRRSAIRETWGTYQNNHSNIFNSKLKWKTLFLVGQSTSNALSYLLNSEVVRHDDILIGDYVDTYRNLTLKVIHGLLFAQRECKSARYVLKTDDDCFVNVPLLIDFLYNYNPYTEGLYVGSIQYGSSVIRVPWSKWYVSKTHFDRDTYPPYASGTGYVISFDLLEPILNLSSRVYPFPNEDAYVGTLVNVLRVQPVHTDRFTLYSYNLRPCNYLYLTIIHGIRSYQQKHIINISNSASRNCPGQKLITTWS